MAAAAPAPHSPTRRILRFGVVVGAAVAWAALAAAGVAALATAVSAPPAATGPGDPCPTGAPRRAFNVSLINIPIFLNRFGDVVPEGRMYVLDHKIAEARSTFQKAADPFNPRDIIEPLAIRANKGDCVEISFTNRLNEPAPPFKRNESIFTLPGEKLLAPGTVTPNPREFAPSLNEPHPHFDPTKAPAASMHFEGLVYDVKGSDGTAVGNNPSSLAAPGATVSYRLYADQEGEFNFADGGDLSSVAAGHGNFIGSSGFGAFGAVVVEPKGATWVDVYSGQPLESGSRAVIKDPNGPDFREHVIFMHDEIEATPGIITKLCEPEAAPDPNAPPEPPHAEEEASGCVDPTPEQAAKLLPDTEGLINGEEAIAFEWFGFNYRSEPGINREEVGCPSTPANAEFKFKAPACVGEETDLSSWPYGDPGGGDLVWANYRGEPTKVRLLHAAEFETHTFHWHVNRWPFDPEDEGGLASISTADHHTTVSNPLDVQAVSPGAHYTLIPEGGAGGAHDAIPATFGDIIFHCHLYPHFAYGMWALNRTHDKLETGTNPDGTPRKNPDGTPVLPLIPLADFAQPPAATEAKPGFPHFVPGVFGYKGPKPPLGVSDRNADGVFPPTLLEQNASDGGYVAGGYFQDPCPAGAPLKVFNVAAIELKVEYNDDLKWTNPQHRMYVLQEHKEAVLNGTRKPEPFSPLLNVGDCVEYHLTNELPAEFGGTVFDALQTTNEVGLHQHLVHFDVLTSDGTANGWNYDQGADPGQTIVYRDFVGYANTTNSFHDHFFPNAHQDNGLFGGATIHPKGCTFHDSTTGAAVKVGTVVDVRCEETSDYHGRKYNGKDYRSASLFIEDHVPMFQPENPSSTRDDAHVTPFGVPIFPPHFPSSPDDYGVMGVNYRLEPFEARRNSDPANLFSSTTHGDPATPLARGYEGDDIKFRLFNLSFEESHAFNLHRFRWSHEPYDKESNVIQGQHLGMLEAFDVSLHRDVEPNRKGLELEDYLYYYGGQEDWFLGAWGLMRVAGCDVSTMQRPDGVSLPPLQPLPDNPAQPCAPPPAVPPVRDAGNPCPSNGSGNIITPIRKYEVVAINLDIVYNKTGDHDPNGVMYVLAEDKAAVLSGAKKPEPLVIRANQGDCVEVTLRNELDPAKMKPHCHEALEAGQLGFNELLTFPECIHDPPKNPNNIPGFDPFPVGSRVSMNAKLMSYEVGSDGANVGYNVDSTVGPGESILYRWYAWDEGLGLIGDRGDVQNHLHHGLYGAIVIEPKDAFYVNPKDGSPLKSGAQAVIDNPNGRNYRENVVLMNSDLSLFRANGARVPDNVDLALAPSAEEDDPEDQGEFSIGYSNEPWAQRVQTDPNLGHVFSSIVHGDPATPLFRSYAGDYTKFHVGQAVGDPRSTGFALHGHRWRRSANDPESQIAANQGQLNPGVAWNVSLDPNVYGGAGNGFAGDYLYRATTLMRHLSGGQWGIFRVLAEKQADLVPLTDSGLVAAYSFDDGAGLTVADDSGTGNAGAIRGASWTGEGRFGGALRFDGGGDVVTVPDADSLDLSTGMTLEAWVKPTALPVWPTVLMKEEAGRLGYGLYANTNASKPAGHGWTSEEFYAAGDGRLPIGEWTHLALTYDGLGFQFFVNGARTSTRVVSGALSDESGPLTIGGNVLGEWFEGSIDEVRVFNRPRTQDQIEADLKASVRPGAPADTSPPTVAITAPAGGATVSGVVKLSADAADASGIAGVQFLVDGQPVKTEDGTSPYSVDWDTVAAANGLHTLTAVARDAMGNRASSAEIVVEVSNAPAPAPAGRLVAAYSFDTGSGTTLADESGNGHAGTIDGASWAVVGKHGGALSFDGIDDMVTVADASALDLTNGMTLEAWVHPTALGSSWRTAVMKEQPGQLVYALYAHTDTNNPSGHAFLGGDTDIRATAPLAAGAWTHLAVTYDGAFLRLYVNGVEVSSRAASGAMSVSDSPLRIGGNAVWGEWFEGLVDDVRIYDRALGSAEIQADMATAVGP